MSGKEKKTSTKNSTSGETFSKREGGGEGKGRRRGGGWGEGGEIKTRLDKQKLGELISISLSPQEVLKGELHTDMTGH